MQIILLQLLDFIILDEYLRFRNKQSDNQLIASIYLLNKKTISRGLFTSCIVLIQSFPEGAVVENSIQRNAII